MRTAWPSSALSVRRENPVLLSCWQERPRRSQIRDPDAGRYCGGGRTWSTTKILPAGDPVLAENGANIVKSYYCDGFERSVRLSGPHRDSGRKEAARARCAGDGVPRDQRRQSAWRRQLGRNIFQSDCPAGMAQAIGKVVHDGYTAAAYEVYEEVRIEVDLMTVSEDKQFYNS